MWISSLLLCLIVAGWLDGRLVYLLVVAFSVIMCVFVLFCLLDSVSVSWLNHCLFI